MQTWKSTVIPPKWVQGQHSVQAAFPDWTYVFLTDDDCLAFVQDFFPEHLRAFQNLPYNIQRADVIRYMWLYVYGGLYLDMDYEVKTPFETYLSSFDAPLMLMHSVHISYVLTNSLIVAKPGQTLFLSMISKALYEQVPTYYGKHLRVMLSTGPMAFHEIVNQSRTAYVVLPRQLFLEHHTKSFTVPLEGQTWNAADSLMLNAIVKYKFEVSLFFGALVLYLLRGFLQYRERVRFLLRLVGRKKRDAAA